MTDPHHRSPSADSSDGHGSRIHRSSAGVGASSSASASSRPSRSASVPGGTTRSVRSSQADTELGRGLQQRVAVGGGQGHAEDGPVVDLRGPDPDVSVAARTEHPLDQQLTGEGPVDRGAGAGVEGDVHGVRVVRQVDQPGGDGDAALGGQDQLEFQLALDDGVVHDGLTSGSPDRDAGPVRAPHPERAPVCPGMTRLRAPNRGLA